MPVTIISTLVAYNITHDIIYSGIVGILVLTGITAQRFMTPDLDIIEKKEYKYGYYPFYVIYKTFGNFPYIIARYYWWPYAKVVKHRSIFSHGFIFGTLVRMTYLFIPIIVVGIFLAINYGSNGSNWAILAFLLPYMGYFTVGWLIADFGHLILDYILPVRHWYEKLLGPTYQWHSSRDGK